MQSQPSKNEDRLRDDFRVFLWLIWRHLDLPEPTPVQLDIAHYLQHGPRRKVVEAFRGVGKSWITSAFVCWLLFRDPDVKILVVSASKDRSDAFSIFTKRLISEIPVLQSLRPDKTMGDRISNVAFDVRAARPAHAPSVKSAGITGQITGSRADYIVLDDVEVPNNSETVTQREKLLVRIAEAGGAILTPRAKAEEDGGVVFLGTPQVEDSIYTKLAGRGYEVRIWPGEVPSEVEKYGGHLAPYVCEMVEKGIAAGTPIDPLRFDRAELAERRMEYGSQGYALQFQLDTTLSDVDRHPLKIRDITIGNTGVDVCPDKFVWGAGPDQIIEHMPIVGLPGDRFVRPVFAAEEWSPYTGAIMYIDPSGRGKDETGYAVVKYLHGQLIARRWGGLAGGYEDKTLAQLATIARDEKVNEVVIEDNFGDGMYSQLFRPVLARIYSEGACKISEEHVTGQKEVRAIETLEPVLASHRLIVDEEVVKADVRDRSRDGDPDSALKSCFYQLSRLTRDRGSLKYDDRVDALAGAVRYWTQRMAADVDDRIKERETERLEEELESFYDLLGKNRAPRTWNGVGTP
jgi:hypothetical protein